ncbi:MAG: hypothetical protein KME21_29080 [Desmonostoc vinosum HA7617-LM4]|nr:hypothetical protein [Desmonostoc vinosum HA7617-LM4]
MSKRTFDYESALSHERIQNLSHDHTSFSLRIFYQQQLWTVTEGKPNKISKQQDWKIAGEFLNANYDENAEGEIVVCDCSYPFFRALMIGDENNEFWQPITCLVNDQMREIDNCPNCNFSLIENEVDEDDFEDPIPSACVGCQNYHGIEYGDNFLVCGIHPYGWDDNECPDYSNK